MKSRTTSRLAWSLCAISVALSLGGAALATVVLSRGLANGHQNPLFTALVLFPITLAWVVVGALVASRRPGNRIAWVYCAIGLGLAMLGASAAYSTLAIHGSDPPLPGGRFTALASEMLFVPCVFIGPVSMFFVFPDGRFLSPRWRLVWLILIPLGLLFGGFLVAFRPGVLSGFGAVENPLGIGGDLGRVMRFLTDDAGAVEGPVAFVIAMLAMITRYRNATGVERQQLKWVFYAVILAIAAFVVSFLAPVAAGSVLFGNQGPADLPAAFVLVLMPVCTGVAILRYRLYDIDRVINRTLVYASLTVCLAMAYLVSVLVLQRALSTVAGGSSLAVAASTLTVAAAFRPARTRIQQVVDRRFFRRRYDATRTLETFGARMRDEVALDALSGELSTVVADTLQPSHVSVWLSDGRA
jgi:hypothetical protein